MTFCISTLKFKMDSKNETKLRANNVNFLDKYI